jgi:hypothetical protein
MRQILGTAVFSGMLGVTIFGIFLTPVFFYVIDRISEASVFGSRRVRLMLIATFALLGTAAIAAVELLMLVSWRNGVLSLGGLIVLSTGLFAVVALVVLRHWLRQTPARLTANLINTLWYRRPRTRPTAGQPTVRRDSNGATVAEAIQVLPSRSSGAPHAGNGTAITPAGREPATKPPEVEGNEQPRRQDRPAPPEPGSSGPTAES